MLRAGRGQIELENRPNRRKEVKKAEGKKAEPTPEPIAPEVKAWMSENPWYGVDQERTGLAMGIANKMRAESSPLKGSAFLAEVKRRLEERWGPSDDGTPAGKVESGRGGGGGSRNGGTEYANLPADARAQCDAQAKKFVGPNKVYKTTKEWNTFFASEYFKGN